ncbi:MAG: GNAT family N-acetyltransferase [Mogibacterium sp.]|nr:GNAT family N-acetyltransferase [Mogibacterium sp.]
MDKNGFEIKSAEYLSQEYEGLRALWCEVFGDTAAYVDAFYENFDNDIMGYVVTDEKGTVCSALTCHLCGTYGERPVYVSYAVCTREEMRGHGLAAKLISFVRDRVTAAGGISIVSPAEPSLVSYYEGLGYEPHFFVTERAAMSPELDFEEYDDFDEFDLDIEGADPTPFRAQIDLQSIPAEKYNRYREAFLAGQPHIEPSTEMLRLIESESMSGNGLYSVNRGDAICSVSYTDPVKVVLTELILNPVLKELSFDIDSEIASMIARYFGAAETLFITPGQGRCQGLTCGLPQESEEQTDEYEYYYEKPYYGFPIE